jgi:hypothetical protein
MEREGSVKPNQAARTMILYPGIKGLKKATVLIAL